MKRQYSIYYDALHEALWLRNHGKEQLGKADLIAIASRGQNPRVIDELISYDRPDAIVCKDGVPILTVEKTREVPTGHNVGQRMARLVRSIEHGVPVIYKMPFAAMKHGAYGNPCQLNIRLLEAFERIWAIHRVPIVALNSPVDENHELIEEATDAAIEQILSDFLPDLDVRAFEPARDQMRREYRERLRIRPAYGEPPSSVSIVRTAAYLAQLRYRVNDGDVDAMLQRPYSVVYTIGMTPEKCRREDPYTGTAFIYDYTLCRNGPRPSDKERNLVLAIPQVSIERWRVANPNDPSRKSSNWYLTATMLTLSNGYVFNNDGQSGSR